MRRRRTAALGVLALATACALPPRPVEFQASPATADGLYRVRTTRVSAAFVRPGADFSRYDAVMIDPVSVSFTHPISEASEIRVANIFQEAVGRQLSRSPDFAVVAAPGPRVLRVTGRIVDLAVDVPPYRGGEVDFVLTAGTMTVILGVRDSQTLTPLARIADRRKIAPTSAGLVGGYRSNPVNTWGAIREICEDWARLLRESLESLRQLPIPPAPPPEAR